MGLVVPNKEFLTDGPVVREFMRRAVPQTKGRFAGQPLDPDKEPWQVDFLDELFLIDPDTGKRVYRTALLGLPKKNGKSTIGSGLGLYGLAFDGPKPGVELEPEAEVYIGASSRDQSKIILRQCINSVKRSKALRRRLRAMTHHITNKQTDGLLKALAAEAGTVQGVNPSMNIVDELGVHTDGGKLLSTLRGSTAAREQPLTVIISHVGWDRWGPLGDMYDDAIEHPLLEVYGDAPGEPLLMIVRDRENGFLFWWYGVREGHDPDDPQTWLKVNPASWIREDWLRSEKNVAGTSRAAFIMWHLNGWVDMAEEPLFEEGLWNSRKDPELILPAGSPVFGGIDFAKKRDTATLVLDAPEVRGDKLHHRLHAIILDPEKVRDSMYVAMETAVDRSARRYDVQEVHYDPWQFDHPAAQLELRGLEMVEFPQNDSRMAPATTAFVEAVKENRLEHDGDKEFTKQIGQTETVETPRGTRISKGKKKTTKGDSKKRKRVDAAVAAAMAVQAAEDAFQRGDFPPSAPQVVVIGGG